MTITIVNDNIFVEFFFFPYCIINEHIYYKTVKIFLFFFSKICECTQLYLRLASGFQYEVISFVRVELFWQNELEHKWTLKS